MLEFVYNKIKNTLRKIDMRLERAKYGYIDRMPKDIQYFEGGLYDAVYEASCKWPHNVALEFFDTQVIYKDLIKKIIDIVWRRRSNLSGLKKVTGLRFVCQILRRLFTLFMR